MRVLIADDDVVSRRVLHNSLKKWGHDVIETNDGDEAWAVLSKPDPPQLAVIDWIMPGIDGADICRRARATEELASLYIILLTAKESRKDVVAGLGAGADDYLMKPFDDSELRARLNVGIRVLDLQDKVTKHVLALENALSEVKQLQGILPICSYCKKVRDDQNFWQQVESYVSDHSEVRFSHSICPPCYESVVEPQLTRQRAERESANAEQPGGSIDE